MYNLVELKTSLGNAAIGKTQSLRGIPLSSPHFALWLKITISIFRNTGCNTSQLMARSFYLRSTHGKQLSCPILLAQTQPSETGELYSIVSDRFIHKTGCPVAF
jgi:hypothetical protein